MSERMRYLILDDVAAVQRQVADEAWIAMHKRADAPPCDPEPARRPRRFAGAARLAVARLTRRPVPLTRSATASAFDDCR